MILMITFIESHNACRFCSNNARIVAFMAASAQAQAEATRIAQRAGIDHKRRAQPSAYLGRKPSYSSPPSLSVIAKAEGLSKQAVFRLKQDPQAALDAWGM
jgi:putative DNA-invertase from lambdoid prophage Rac